jgi:hypothetical protein
MTPERFRRIDELIALVMKHEARDRKAFLDEACAGDAELRREVESLLACDEESGAFLARPAAQVVARGLADDAEEDAKEGATAAAPPSVVGVTSSSGSSVAAGWARSTRPMIRSWAGRSRSS